MLSKFGMSFKYITPNMVQYMILSHVVFLYAFAVFSFGFPILCCGDDDDDDDDFNVINLLSVTIQCKRFKDIFFFIFLFILKKLQDGKGCMCPFPMRFCCEKF